jgi:hypothetical protein
MQRNGAMDPFGNYQIQLPDGPTELLRRIDDMPDYLAFCSERKGYWFVVYENPRPHAELDRLLKDPTLSEEELDVYMGEISREMVGQIAKQMTGLEILFEHDETSKTLGIVHAAFQDEASGTLLALVRPFENEDGRVVCGMIEAGIRGCSLRHALGVRDGNYYIQIQELSVCAKGKRPGTWLQCAVDLEHSPRLPYHPREYEVPVFLFSEKTPHTSQRVSDSDKTKSKTRHLTIPIPTQFCLQTHAHRLSPRYKTMDCPRSRYTMISPDSRTLSMPVLAASCHASGATRPCYVNKARGNSSRPCQSRQSHQSRQSC